jgi:hypothetical protein
MKVVVAGQFNPSHAPIWACLKCEPRWLEIHDLAVEEERHQLQLEDCVARMNFDSAVEWRDKRRVVHEKIRERLAKLGVETDQGRGRTGG